MAVPGSALEVHLNNISGIRAVKKSLFGPHLSDKTSMPQTGWRGSPATRKPKNEVIINSKPSKPEKKESQKKEELILLEKDVAQLKIKLQKEVSVRRALERGLNRPVGSLPRLSPYLPQKIRELLAEVALLEEEIFHLEDQVGCLQQDLAKVHSAPVEIEKSNCQKKTNSIAETGAKKKPLGKSVASNSFKQVPTDAAVQSQESQPPSSVVPCKIVSSEGQQKDTLSQPNKPKTPRKNRASTLYNQRNNAVRLRSKSPAARVRRNSQNCKEEVQKQRLPIRQKKHMNSSSIEATASSIEATANRKVACKVQSDEVLTAQIPNILSPFGVLDDYQIAKPNRLSEEMVRCLLNIFVLMIKSQSVPECDSPTAGSTSTLSTSSLQSIDSKSNSSIQGLSECASEIDWPDPYGVREDSELKDTGAYRNFISIKADSVATSCAPHTAFFQQRLKSLITRLGLIDLRGMSHRQKLAFWINIYNASMMHAFLEYGVPGNARQVLTLARKATLNVGGHMLNPLAIEHVILRLPSSSKQTCTNERVEKRIQSSLCLKWSEPLVNFALSCGTQSSPAVRIYTAPKVEGELETAKREYLEAAVGVTRKKKILIPKLLDWNLGKFAKDAETLMNWLMGHLSKPLQEAVQECLKKTDEAFSTVLEVMPYDFTFRYLLRV